MEREIDDAGKSVKTPIQTVFKMLFVEDVPGGTRVVCEGCDGDQVVLQGAIDSVVICENCGCTLVYPEGASW